MNRIINIADKLTLTVVAETNYDDNRVEITTRIDGASYETIKLFESLVQTIAGRLNEEEPPV
jgi:hypothetical protein